MMISPVKCACSNTQEHTIEHIECRCNGYELFRNSICDPPYPPERVFVKNCKDGDWELCRYCGKIRDFPGYLVVCPECGVKFKGPRPYFPIDFECENCG